MKKCKIKNNINGVGTCTQTIKIKLILIVDEETGKLVERYNLDNYESKNKFYPLKK